MEDSYGPERVPWRARLSLVGGGVRERARQSGLSGDSAPPPDRVRAGTLLVLVGWAAFAFAGLSFAKFSEHFDDALPGGINSHLPPAAHTLPDVAYSILQWVATVAGIAVLLGAALVVPSLVRYLKSNGWRAIRGHLVRAVSVTVLTVGVTGSLIGWAHHLSSQQRNGGDSLYSAIFIVWGALVAFTLAAWTGGSIGGMPSQSGAAGAGRRVRAGVPRGRRDDGNARGYGCLVGVHGQRRAVVSQFNPERSPGESVASDDGGSHGGWRRHWTERTRSHRPPPAGVAPLRDKPDTAQRTTSR